MGTKTVDETGAATRADEETAEAAAADAAGEGAAGTAPRSADEAGEAPETAEKTGEALDAGAGPDNGEAPDSGEAKDAGAAGEAGPSGVGQGAGAVVSAGLGIVSLTGGWIGTVASARQSLIGQLETSSSSDIATMIEKGYGNAWHATALWGGLFALAALIVGVVVLARPAFGAPGRPQAPWIKSVAWAGVALGVIGLLLAALKYTDVLLGLPSTS
ncbi:membrane protein [Streptomyces cyaneogriseus subsp. noncyanogenus]|uniref:Membrane protein n=1 Tax=Streptomyces cyaneogriseus subsp. noncyanogenus TaxID=477245 RepID=A0A0C5G6S0_9ACTN|nr:hypothetical protein [Streptomyces cyaneogriseus]AJP03944.1 membrane protein [Streptomyces cyaneogriseus subsp. noncyanogenus]